jgi:hypothetical protein
MVLLGIWSISYVPALTAYMHAHLWRQMWSHSRVLVAPRHAFKPFFDAASRPEIITPVQPGFLERSRKFFGPHSLARLSFVSRPKIITAKCPRLSVWSRSKIISAVQIYLRVRFLAQKSSQPSKYLRVRFLESSSRPCLDHRHRRLERLGPAIENSSRRCFI